MVPKKLSEEISLSLSYLVNKQDKINDALPSNSTHNIHCYVLSEHFNYYKHTQNIISCFFKYSPETVNMCVFQERDQGPGQAVAAAGL